MADKVSGKCIFPAIDLSERVKQRRMEFAKFLMNCSQIHVQGIWQSVADYTLDEEVLIPNTTNIKEFSKYWYIVPNGVTEINQFRHLHDVKIQPSSNGEYVEIRLIKRGAIASINEYIPSKTAALKIECQIQWKHRNDFMTFSTRSDGTRRTDDQWGGVDHGGRVMKVVQHGWGSPGLYTFLGECKGWPQNKYYSAISKVPRPPYMGTVRIVDDGETVGVYYKDTLGEYELVQKGTSNGKRNHIAIYNREQPDCVSDITSLTVSVLMQG